MSVTVAESGTSVSVTILGSRWTAVPPANKNVL
jgi:hypothetical protein